MAGTVGINQTPMYTKKQVCELLRQNGINIDNIYQVIDMYDMANKYVTDRHRRYMQFKRENDPEFMERVLKNETRIVSMEQNRDY